MDKMRVGREGVSRFSIGNFFSQLPKKLTRAPFCAVFQKIPVAKMLLINREGGGRQYHGVLLKVSFPRFPENVVEELACTLYQKKSGSEIKHWIRVDGGGKHYQIFP